MEFAHDNGKCLLKVLQKRPNLSLEDAHSFKLSTKAKEFSYR
jgi:hypothetical protein